MVRLNLRKKLTFLGVFTGAALGTMHIINRLFYYLSTADNLLDQNNYEYYNWRFGKIAYIKKGKGSPILLIHNLDVCSSSYEWNNIINKLSETNTVYAIDLLGCGCSEKPMLTYTNFLYVQLITDFIKNIIKEKTDIIASGESNAFALMACANDDSVIKRVIMINPENLVTLSKNPGKHSNMIKYLLLSPVIGTFIYNMKVNKRTIREQLKEKYYYDHNKIREEDILTYFESSHRDKIHSKYLYACQKSRFTNANVTCCLNKLTNSIFIIIGNNNPENLLIANQYQNHLQSIEILGIDMAKQVPHMEKPEEFIEQVNVLLSSDE